MEHELKIWPHVFQDVLLGTKTFEYRKDDRDFHVGDTLILREWSPDTGEYTGRETIVAIVYKTDGGQFGIPSGYCVLGIKREGEKACLV